MSYIELEYSIKADGSLLKSIPAFSLYLLTVDIWVFLDLWYTINFIDYILVFLD